ncbi:MAG TPA: class I mannose-6-phosphate isomerase [Bryobacteraceae bacterium]|jgi:mannose-6-phosphate isomerase|nr:class I mannose-6-phosphate isomerase [Bryobacteraceae bacterium]
MRPRRLSPDFREKIWGATKLSPWFPDSDRKIGEVWFDAGLPLLVKFIFTSEKLSVQVHPDDDYARRHHGSRGKTEMWHILAAEPGARIAAGFREPLTRQDLREAARTGAIEQLLEWHQARPGDTFFIPAGTVHAIGGGLALLEIQQNSDVTYRLYDYGRPRELHLDHACEVSRLGPHPARRDPDAETLVTCPHFVTRKFEVRDRLDFSFRQPGFVIAVSGQGEIDGNSMKSGDVLMYSGENQAISVRGNVTIVSASFA